MLFSISKSVASRTSEEVIILYSVLVWNHIWSTVFSLGFLLHE